MMKISPYFCLLLLFLFSCSPKETLQQQANGRNKKKKGASSTRLEVAHMLHGNGSSSSLLTLREILARDQLRSHSIQSAYASNKVKGDNHVQIKAQSGNSYYYVTVYLGSPTQKVKLMFDTGSDVTWTQCHPCPGKDCYKQDDKLFDPHASSSYKRVPCDTQSCANLGQYKRQGSSCHFKNPHCAYLVEYNDGTNTSGIYARDKLTLTLGRYFRYFHFGCGNYNQGEFHSKVSGILGLGRGASSFVSQTKNKYNGVFSYCLPEEGSTGFLSFGEEYEEDTEYKMFQFTPMLKGRSDHYYIEMTAITVGSVRLHIDESVFTNAGMVIDTGAMVTHLPPGAYVALKKEYTKQMKDMTFQTSPTKFGILDTCFKISIYDQIPSLHFTFKDDATIRIPRSGVLIHVNRTMACLAFVGNTRPGAVAQLGSTQQIEIEVMYDVPGKKIGFSSRNQRCY